MDNVKEGPVISCVVVNPINNKLRPGQQPGDATEFSGNFEIEVNSKIPTISMFVKTHEVTLSGYRIDSNGPKTKVNRTNMEERRKYQKIIERYQRITKRSNYDIIDK